MFWEDWPENLLSVEDAVECCPDPQQDWGTHFLSHPLLLAAVGSQFLPQNCPQQKLPCQLHHLPRDTLLPVTGGDRDTALVSIPHLWRVIQLQHALWDGLTSLQQRYYSSISGSAFWGAWDLATKRQIILTCPGFRFSKTIAINGELFGESSFCFWALESLFWC